MIILMYIDVMFVPDETDRHCFLETNGNSVGVIIYRGFQKVPNVRCVRY